MLDQMKPTRAGRATAVGITLLAAAAIGLPTFAAAEDTATDLQFIVVSDDIRKDVTAVARPDGTTGGPGGGDEAPNAGDVGEGKSNNGHGNNADGVDSSNPGAGNGGPNGAVDESGSVDDEAGGGGASPSKGKSKGKKK